MDVVVLAKVAQMEKAIKDSRSDIANILAQVKPVNLMRQINGSDDSYVVAMLDSGSSSMLTQFRAPDEAAFTLADVVVPATDGAFKSLDFDPVTNMLYVLTYNGVKKIDVTTGEVVATLPATTGHHFGVSSNVAAYRVMASDNNNLYFANSDQAATPVYTLKCVRKSDLTLLWTSPALGYTPGPIVTNETSPYAVVFQMSVGPRGYSKTTGAIGWNPATTYVPTHLGFQDVCLIGQRLTQISSSVSDGTGIHTSSWNTGTTAAGARTDMRTGGYATYGKFLPDHDCGIAYFWHRQVSTMKNIEGGRYETAIYPAGNFNILYPAGIVDDMNVAPYNVNGWDMIAGAPRYVVNGEYWVGLLHPAADGEIGLSFKRFMYDATKVPTPVDHVILSTPRLKAKFNVELGPLGYYRERAISRDMTVLLTKAPAAEAGRYGIVILKRPRAPVAGWAKYSYPVTTAEPTSLKIWSYAEIYARNFSEAYVTMSPASPDIWTEAVAKTTNADGEPNWEAVTGDAYTVKFANRPYTFTATVAGDKFKIKNALQMPIAWVNKVTLNGTILASSEWSFDAQGDGRTIQFTTPLAINDVVELEYDLLLVDNSVPFVVTLKRALPTDAAPIIDKLVLAYEI